MTTGRSTLTQTTDPSVGFDRDQNAYLLTIDPQRRRLVGLPRPPAVRLLVGARPGTNGPVQTLRLQAQVYSWDGNGLRDLTADAGRRLELAQLHRHRLDRERDLHPDRPLRRQRLRRLDLRPTRHTTAEPADSPSNPNTIKVLASSDQGADFTHDAYVDDTVQRQSTAATRAPTAALPRAVYPAGVGDQPGSETGQRHQIGRRLSRAVRSRSSTTTTGPMPTARRPAHRTGSSTRIVRPDQLPRRDLVDLDRCDRRGPRHRAGSILATNADMPVTTTLLPDRTSTSPTPSSPRSRRSTSRSRWPTRTWPGT